MSGHRATQADAGAAAGIRARAQALLASGANDGNDGSVGLNEGQCRPLLAGAVPFGLATPVAGVTEALAAAQVTGYPVVCKLLDPAVVHKTELGPVRRAIADDEALAKAAADLLERGREL